MFYDNRYHDPGIAPPARPLEPDSDVRSRAATISRGRGKSALVPPVPSHRLSRRAAGSARARLPRRRRHGVRNPGVVERPTAAPRLANGRRRRSWRLRSRAHAGRRAANASKSVSGGIFFRSANGILIGASVIPGSTDITAETRGNPCSLANAATLAANIPPSEWPTVANFVRSGLMWPGSVCKRLSPSLIAIRAFGVNSWMPVNKLA